ncbi:MAG: TM0996/MTH895 family glutaredoxin-like protein [Proteobacteria bacterium]|nr:TM0996/MTH895 family glutaredoxin-like protein [Pseudomonadota bacterium]MBU1687826.1 TM0996/MTH895 family glutaredoxin-like protein [Pseudomonadota bacterium]
MNIKICGPGCASCTKTEEIVRQAVADSEVNAIIEKITDFADIAQLGVLSTPAVLINDRIKCVGKIPTQDEVNNWLKYM